MTAARGWWLGLLALAVLVAPVEAAGSAAAGEVARGSFEAEPVAGGDALADSLAGPRLYLAWGAPHGMPGARAHLDLSHADTCAVDTLFLSFETGGDGPSFHGMFGKLYFHPAFGESLGGFWDFGPGGANRGQLTIQFDPDGTFPCAQPWNRPGMGHVAYEFQPAVGRLDLFYVVSAEDALPVSGRTRYCFARVLLDRRLAHLPGRDQRVCIGWEEARFNMGGDDITVTRGPGRFVSASSPDGSVCVPYRRAPKPEVWTPPPPE
jgi:hypothetical protein